MLCGKKKISEYLTGKQNAQSTAFDVILADYLSGALKRKLQDLSMQKIEIHIDWLPEYQCINIAGKANGFFFDIQVEPSTFSLAYDKDEPDDAADFLLKDAMSFYQTIESAIAKIR